MTQATQNQPGIAYNTPMLPQPRLQRGGWWAAVRPQAGHYGMLITLTVILTLMMVWPVSTMIVQAFKPVTTDSGATSYFHWIAAALSSPTFMFKLGNSLLLATVVTLLCNTIAMPLALISHRYSFRGKALFSAIVLVPMVLPPFVGAIGMRQLLGKFGSLTILLQEIGILAPDQGVNWLKEGGFWACAVLIALGLYPIAYLNLQAALANIDPAMTEAAENLGGRRVRNFFKITLPLAMPGIFAGSTIIFIWAFTELGTPLLLNYPYVVSRDIFDLLATASAGASSEAAAKVTIVLAVSVLAYVIGKNTLGRQAYAMTSKAAVAATMRKLAFLPGLLAAAPFALVTFLAMLPHMGVILYSFTAIAVEPGVGWGAEGTFGWYRSIIPTRYTLAGYEAVFGTPEIYGSILNSLKYASIATVVDIILGISIAWVLVRTRVWGRTALDTLAMMPLAVPGLVMAFGYIAVIHSWPLNTEWFRSMFEKDDLLKAPTFVVLILVIAYSTRRLPYLVRSAVGGLQQTSVSLEEAAANLGASPLRTILKITLPLIMANLIAGAVLTFSFAMLEVSDSLILAQLPQDYPITKQIYALGNDASSADNIRNACALGVLAMLLLIGTLVTAALLMGKRLGAIFRA